MRPFTPFLVLALSACMGFGSKPPEQLLTLTAASARTAQPGRTVPTAEAVTVVPPAVPQELNTLRVPVRSGTTSVTYLKDAQWVEMPNSLFGRLLAETIASNGRVVLDPSQYSLSAGVRLTGQLQAFGLDADRMEAVAIYDAALKRGASDVEVRRFEAHVPVAQDNVAAVAPALNEAANQIAAEVAKWVG